MLETIISYRVKVKGVVQGVGFRPFVYRLASECSLNGWVLNSSQGVLIHIEGTTANTTRFIENINLQLPPLAKISSIEVEETISENCSDFTIKESIYTLSNTASIPADIAVCPECKSEITNPSDRRHNYPFTNCTNCGPRFTIIQDIPYDRSSTTMSSFTMCPQCEKEYNDPKHRRFHAEPNSCPNCGPFISIIDSKGNKTDESVVSLLKKGHIVAIKGLGAFHLAVNANDPHAVAELRIRKHREAKPFALMVPDLEKAHKYCTMNAIEEKLLTSAAAPIVILHAKEANRLPIDIISPGLDTCGIMLPYTPLHFLLFGDDLDALVMTSANISDEPLITDNEQAITKLAGIADYFLLHNRDICNPCDDSVVAVTKLNTEHFYRRARGFVPYGIQTPGKNKPVLALGGEMKNTFCFLRSNEAFLSQHWGNLIYYHNFLNFQDGIKRFQEMLAISPQIIAHDLHPEYQTTHWAKTIDSIPTIAVQHHHAHLASAMAENLLDEEVLGIICDGSGWGSDNNIWGGEILCGDYRGFKRLAHLKYLPLISGDQTAKRPYQMAMVYLLAAFGYQSAQMCAELLPSLSSAEATLLLNRLQSGQVKYFTSSCGRLFDAVAAIIGICEINQHEGHAAELLEAIAKRADHKQFENPANIYSYCIENNESRSILEMNPLPLIKDLVNDLNAGQPLSLIALRFHMSLAHLLAETLNRLGAATGISKVVLSGGVFHNQLLLEYIVPLIESSGFKVYYHTQVPPGDGGISLGQAMIASEVLRTCV